MGEPADDFAGERPQVGHRRGGSSWRRRTLKVELPDLQPERAFYQIYNLQEKEESEEKAVPPLREGQTVVELQAAEALTPSSLGGSSPAPSYRPCAQIMAYVEFFGQFTSEQFPEDVAQLIQNNYPSKERRLLDEVLAIFVLHHPEHGHAVVHPILSCIIDGTLVYDKNEPPFSSFISLVGQNTEIWYYMALILFAGYLKNAEVSVDALSICMNILGWAAMVAVGSNAATSVRVSNELGAGHPRTAKFSVVVVVVTSFLIGLTLSLLLLITRKQFPDAFTNSEDVKNLVYRLTPLLAASITINNVQPVLSGVAIGAGWQAIVAYVNVACYYLFGIPLGLMMAYMMGGGVRGIWYGMLSGTILQTLILFWMTYRTNWHKEASIAGDRIKKWGGEDTKMDEEQHK